MHFSMPNFPQYCSHSPSLCPLSTPRSPSTIPVNRLTSCRFLLLRSPNFDAAGARSQPTVDCSIVGVLEVCAKRGELTMPREKRREFSRTIVRWDMVTCYDRGLFTSSDLYAPPQHVVPSHAAGVASEGILSPLGGRFMQDPASELRRIPLPRNRVNRGVVRAF
jgi:hypothetical protein